ncbi:MAG: hypothetical protein WAK96_01010 [Desulfobaccales bacterium]
MKDKELRGVILENFYKMRREGFFQPEPEDFDPPIPSEDLYRICEQLNEHGLIHFKPMRRDSIKGTGSSITIGGFGKITAKGVDVVEDEGRNSPINVSITNNIFNQSFIFDIEQILLKINDVGASDEQKNEAKARLRSFIEHPLVTSIIGGILGNLPGLLK